MKAIVIHEHGGPEVLRLENVPMPEPGLGEVLIRNHSVGLNHLDHDIREGLSGFGLPLPHIMGLESAGEVVAVGDGVQLFQRGDSVAPAFTLSSGRCKRTVCNCEKGWDNLCLDSGILGVTEPGTYAEYVVASQHNVISLPAGLSYELASAVQTTMGTAWHMVNNQIVLRSGETILVNAAGGGIGSAAIQVAKLAGGRIIASAGNDAKLERAHGLGADEVINYRDGNLAEDVLAMTDGRGVDAVIESVGGDVLLQSMQALAVGGRMAVCGAHAGEKVTMNMVDFFRKNIVLYGTHGATKAQISEVFDLVARKKLTPAIHQIFEFNDVVSAHRMADSRQFFGKILLSLEGTLD